MMQQSTDSPGSSFSWVRASPCIITSIGVVPVMPLRASSPTPGSPALVFLGGPPFVAVLTIERHVGVGARGDGHIPVARPTFRGHAFALAV